MRSVPGQAGISATPRRPCRQLQSIRRGRHPTSGRTETPQSIRPRSRAASADLDRLDRHLAQHADDRQERLEGEHAVEAGVGELDVDGVNVVLVERRVDRDPAPVDVDLVPDVEAEAAEAVGVDQADATRDGHARRRGTWRRSGRRARCSRPRGSAPPRRRGRRRPRSSCRGCSCATQSLDPHGLLPGVGRASPTALRARSTTRSSSLVISALGRRNSVVDRLGPGARRRCGPAVLTSRTDSYSCRARRGASAGGRSGRRARGRRP